MPKPEPNHEHTCVLAKLRARRRRDRARPPQELWHRYHQPADQRQRKTHLVEQYLPLVRSVAGPAGHDACPTTSTTTTCTAPAWSACSMRCAFDPACGTSFETYARVRIRGAMLDELRRMDWVPRSVHEKAAKFRTVMAAARTTTRPRADRSRSGQALNLSPAEYSEPAGRNPSGHVRLPGRRLLRRERRHRQPHEVVADPTEDGPVEQATRNELKQIILAAAQGTSRNPAQSAGSLLWRGPASAGNCRGASA